MGLQEEANTSNIYPECHQKEDGIMGLQNFFHNTNAANNGELCMKKSTSYQIDVSFLLYNVGERGMGIAFETVAQAL